MCTHVHVYETWNVHVHVCRQSSSPVLSLPTGLLQLIDDIQSSIEQGKKLIESTEVTNPVKVTYAIKQLAKEAAVGK